MRRRWKVLVAVGAVALVAGLLFLLPSRDDGLDWVRKYGGTERHLDPAYWRDRSGLPRNEVFVTTFTFGRFPDGFIQDLHSREIEHADQTWLVSDGALSDGYAYALSYSKGAVSFRRTRLLNWFELKWMLVKRTFKFGRR